MNDEVKQFVTIDFDKLDGFLEYVLNNFYIPKTNF